jgi:hypothetical protein
MNCEMTPTRHQRTASAIEHRQKSLLAATNKQIGSNPTEPPTSAVTLTRAFYVKHDLGRDHSDDNDGDVSHACNDTTFTIVPVWLEQASQSRTKLRTERGLAYLVRINESKTTSPETHVPHANREGTKQPVRKTSRYCLFAMVMAVISRSSKSFVIS